MIRRYGYRRSAGNKIKGWWIVLLIAVVALAAVLFLVLTGRERRTAQFEESPQEVVVKDTLYRYGLPIEYFSVLYDTVAPHQTLAELLMENGLTASKVYALTSQCPDSVFDVRKVRAGQPCALLSNLDSMATPRYFVYEVNAKEYAVFNLMTNQVTRGEHPSEWRERVCGGVVESSLWNAMVASDASPQFAYLRLDN